MLTNVAHNKLVTFKLFKDADSIIWQRLPLTEVNL